jgi:hypothetical protein
MNMWQVVAVVILEEHGHQDAVEHADGWHISSNSRLSYTAHRPENKIPTRDGQGNRISPNAGCHTSKGEHV